MSKVPIIRFHGLEHTSEVDYQVVISERAALLRMPLRGMMNFLGYFLSLLVATLLVKMLVLPIFAGLQIMPAQKLEAHHPRAARAWLLGFAPVLWIVHIVWLAFTVWLTRTRGMRSTPWLWPLFLLFGLSGALYPTAKAGRFDEEGAAIRGVLMVIWTALMVASFFFIKPAR